MKVDGRCHCGQITYEAIVDPKKVGLCHCTDCQMLTGSVYRVTVPAPRETFVLRSGEPRIYVKTADSGTKRAHAFCPKCGTPIYSAAVSDPPTYSLRVGCLAQRRELRPTRQQWCRSALAWAMNLEGVPQTSGQ
ncbi:MAG TPA: GFA family protein [Candidatus Binatia bacterium]|nr:GFA family protein [Candidatus Binatia bacterium]